MYVPAQFAEDRLPVLHDAIDRTGLATLVTVGTSGLEASHVPMLLDRSKGRLGTLYGHLARPNPQWRETDSGSTALAIFLGPDAYVTPSWYATKQQTGKVVPTWNYVAVHAHGVLTFFEDPEQLLSLVSKLTNLHESVRTNPWNVTDAPEGFIRSQLKGIIGFELPIERITGKWKMSQNRPEEDRAGVADGLRREGKPDIAAHVEERSK
jgi:transcriptional regulator